MEPRRGPLVWAWCATGIVTLATPVPLPAQAERYTIPGPQAAVYNLAGEVDVRGGSGEAVEVEVRRGGADAGRLSIARGPVDGFETLRILYPGERIVYPGEGRVSNAELRVRDDGTFYDGGRGERGRRVTVASDGRGLEAHADLSLRIPPGRSVAVYLAVGRVTVSNVEGELLVDVGSADVSATGTRGALSIDTGSGNVRVATAEGRIRADTGSGEVELEDVRGEQLIADTGSGDVRGSRISVAELLVDTGSGEVHLSALSAMDVRVDTGSGSVSLSLLSDANWIEVDTGSGEVDVSLPAGFGAEVEIETGSGEIAFDVPIEVTRVQRSSLRGRLGDGGGRLTVDTGSGSVTLRRSGAAAAPGAG